MCYQLLLDRWRTIRRELLLLENEVRLLRLEYQEAVEKIKEATRDTAEKE